MFQEVGLKGLIPTLLILSGRMVLLVQGFKAPYALFSPPASWIAAPPSHVWASSRLPNACSVSVNGAGLRLGCTSTNNSAVHVALLVVPLRTRLATTTPSSSTS